MRRYRAALTVALATGCATQGASSYHAAIAHAADRWEHACGVRPVPASVVVYWAWAHVPCGRSRAAVGCTDGAGHVALAGQSTAPVEGLVVHEFGHVLGAGHLATGLAGVMVSDLRSNNWRQCITADDLDAVGVCTTRRPECR